MRLPYLLLFSLMIIETGKGEYYEKEIIFSVWPSGRVIKTEEEHEDSIKTGNFKLDLKMSNIMRFYRTVLHSKI